MLQFQWAVIRTEALSKRGNVDVTFSRTGDPSMGDSSDAKVFGDVPDDLSPSSEGRGLPYGAIQSLSYLVSAEGLEPSTP